MQTRLLAFAAWLPMLAFAPFLAACPQTQEPSWELVHEDLGGALLAVTSIENRPDELFVVGAADAQGPTFLHFDEGVWTRESLSGSEDLWWVSRHPDESIYASGESGRIVHRLHSGEFRELNSATDATLYGLWFAEDGSGWAVGGDPQADGTTSPRGTIQRYLSGVPASFGLELSVPAEVNETLLFKVWGSAPDDVWVVGELGRTFHWDGNAWTFEALDTNQRLITVHGEGDQRIIAGGVSSPLLQRFSAPGWMDAGADLPPEAIMGLNGAFVRDGQAYLVGNLGLFAQGPVAGGPMQGEVLTNLGLHAVHVGSDGDVWVVGGDLLGLNRGTMLHFGEQPPATGL